MSERNFLIDLVNSIKVPADLTKAALDPSAKQIGEGLGSLFYLAFAPIEKAKIKKEYEITRFKEEIEAELAKVAPSELIEPPLNVVGPALEASKYYIENDGIRSMFTKLIVSSMNSQLSDSAHSSFVEIIKQFSPLDAINFQYLINNAPVALANIRLLKKDDPTTIGTWITNFFPFPDLEFNNWQQYSASIDNLIRLGLINVDPALTFSNDSLYDSLLNHPLYKSCELVLKDNTQDPQNQDRIIELNKKYWLFTTFGSSFAQCCL
ncbi:hypothetical protein J2T13_003648 [Paenibacillus sp. DS2015]|uniref:DUF4393 domain-containing protein n=1 Tax=Paenibacillus sp. DS2015 TaxID=3373917 RepID=UPI003D200DCB